MCLNATTQTRAVTFWGGTKRLAGHLEAVVFAESTVLAGGLSESTAALAAELDERLPEMAAILAVLAVEMCWGWHDL